MEDKNQSLAAEELKQLLCDELDKKQPDRETVLSMLETLEQKENKKLEQQASKRRRWIRNTAVAAAVLLVFVFIAPPAFGAENIFELVGRWTKETFAFGTTEYTTAPQHDYVFKTDHPGLQQLYDAVSELGITQRVVPTWLSDGYELTELKKSEDLNGSSIYAKFERDNDTVAFLLSPASDDYYTKYAKNDEDVIVYEVAGIKHYLMQNESQWTAVWCFDVFVCSIYADCDKDTILDIINSIYL